MRYLFLVHRWNVLRVMPLTGDPVSGATGRAPRSGIWAGPTSSHQLADWHPGRMAGKGIGRKAPLQETAWRAALGC